MWYRDFPNMRLRPSCICLGTADFGTAQSEADSFAQMDFFLEHGGNILDTAHIYGTWVAGQNSASEKTIGKWLKSRGNRDAVLIATKGAHPDLGNMAVQRLSPAEIGRDLDESLAHLGIDTVDLYWLHRDDPAREVGEIVTTMDNLVKKGKIRLWGLSNWRCSRFREAVAYSRAHGLSEPAGNQLLWSLATVNPGSGGDPTIVAMDGETWEYHRESNTAVMPFTSQARGYFSKLRSGAQMQDWVRNTYENPANLARFERLTELSARTGVAIEALVVAWLTAQPFLTIPIISSRNIEQLARSLAAADLRPDAEARDYLSEGV